MATAKTATFILTERLDITSTTTGTAIVDLGSYVDVGSRQGVAIEKVDFTIQGYDTSNGNIVALNSTWSADNQVDVQLFDLNQTALQPNDNRSLIASGSLLYDLGGNMASQATDIFPDNFGKLTESRLVVNDDLTLVGRMHISALEADRGIYLVVRVHAKIVKINSADWMAIAIQSTAADN